MDPCCCCLWAARPARLRPAANGQLRPVSARMATGSSQLETPPPGSPPNSSAGCPGQGCGSQISLGAPSTAPAPQHHRTPSLHPISTWGSQCPGLATVDTDLETQCPPPSWPTSVLFIRCFNLSRLFTSLFREGQSCPLPSVHPSFCLGLRCPWTGLWGTAGGWLGVRRRQATVNFKEFLQDIFLNFFLGCFWGGWGVARAGNSFPLLALGSFYTYK